MSVTHITKIDHHKQHHRFCERCGATMRHTTKIERVYFDRRNGDRLVQTQHNWICSKSNPEDITITHDIIDLGLTTERTTNDARRS